MIAGNGIHAMLHGFQQSLIVLLFPHQDGNQVKTKLYSRQTALGWPQGHFPVRETNRNRFANPSCVILISWLNIVAGNSLYGEVAQRSGIYKFQSCSLCRESSRRERVAKIPYLPLVLDVALIQQLFVTQSL